MLLKSSVSAPVATRIGEKSLTSCKKQSRRANGEKEQKTIISGQNGTSISLDHLLDRSFNQEEPSGLVEEFSLSERYLEKRSTTITIADYTRRRVGMTSFLLYLIFVDFYSEMKSD